MAADPASLPLGHHVRRRPAGVRREGCNQPLQVHLNHAQDEPLIRFAADNLPFDSIMVDMSHYEKEENLAKTAQLVRYCHDWGIVTVAKPGSIEGGENGVLDTALLEGSIPNREEVREFRDTSLDCIAPAFGSVFCEYGPKRPRLDFKSYGN